MSSTREVWRPAPAGFSKYEVSSLGRVRSLFHSCGSRRQPPLILKPRVLPESGHRVFNIRDDSHRLRAWMAGRLVLTAFRGLPPDPSFETSHLDGKSANDRLDNLVWESHADNEARKVGHGTLVRGEKSRGAKLNEVKVLEFRARFAAGESLSSILKDSNVTQATLSFAVRGKTWKHVPMASEAQT